MAHNITERDLQVGLEQAWHGLTQVVESINVKDNWLTRWDIASQPLYMQDGTEIDHRILVATDDGKAIGKPYALSYSPVTNLQFMELVDDALSKIPGSKIESVGSVRSRGRVFVTVSVKGHDSYKIKNREFRDFLNFGNSHDQSASLWVNNSNICTVCDNTFSYNYNSSGLSFGNKVVHRGNMTDKLLNVKKLIDNYFVGQENFILNFEKLSNIKVTEKRARDIFTGFVRRNEINDKSSEVTSRTVNRVEGLIDLFNSGRGNRGETYADMFSAVTDYFTHSSTRSSGQNKANQFFSSEFGLGRSNKEDFWQILNNEDKLEKIVKFGEKLNINYATNNN
jgi:hypothetical protein